MRPGTRRCLSLLLGPVLLCAAAVATAQSQQAYEAVQWFGVLAPAGTPREIISRVHGEIVRLLQVADIKERLLSDGAEPVGSSPEAFAAFMRAETVKWAKVVKNAGIKPE